MCKDFSDQQFYSLFPILTLFVSLSASTLSIAPSLITSAVSHWFTQEACERAEDVTWDHEADRPISKEELFLDSLLDDDEDNWFDDLDDTQTQFAEVQLDVSNRPTRFQEIQSNPLEGDEESVHTFYKATDLPGLNGEEGAANPTIGRPASAEGSRESPAPLVA